MANQTKLSIAFCCIVLLALFNNCGQAFESTGPVNNTTLSSEIPMDSSNPEQNSPPPIDTIISKNKCDAIKSESFLKDGFYNFVKTNCIQCHISGGMAQGSFADNNPNIAFATFNSFGWARLFENATDDKHPGPKNGPGLKPKADELNLIWEETLNEYNVCEKNNIAQSNRAYDILTNENNISVTDQWKTISWSLNNNFFEKNIKHKINIDFKVDIQNYYGEEEKTQQPIGYLFRKPRIQFKGTENKIYFESITLLNNGVPLENFEVWEQLQTIVDKNSINNGQIPDSIIINEEHRQFTFISDNILSYKNISVVFSHIVDNTDGKNSGLIPKEPSKIKPQ